MRLENKKAIAREEQKRIFGLYTTNVERFLFKLAE
jgi:hypothetical protein